MHFKKICFPLFIVLISIILVFPSTIWEKPFEESNTDITYAKPKVLKVHEEELQRDEILTNIFKGYQVLDIEILDGIYTGEQFNIKNYLSRLYNVRCKEDMKVIVSIYSTDGVVQDISIQSYNREPFIYGLVALFFLLLLIIGKKNGLMSILLLCFTIIVILFYMLPNIFSGKNMTLISIISCSIITIVTLTLMSGFTKKSFSAICGTVLGVVLAGTLALISSKLCMLSGVTIQEADSILFIADQYKINIQGILFVATLIGSLGAIMDVSMSISSSMHEIHNLNNNISKMDLFKSCMNIGRYIIGTMSNTLILAFIGGSITLMLFIYASDLSYVHLINSDIIATEIIQSLCGSIGIILGVPITAFISTLITDLNL